MHSVNISKVLELCRVFKGQLISSQEVRGRGGNGSWQFKCSNGHDFIVTTCKLSHLETIDLSDEKCHQCWCLKCKNFHMKCLEKIEQENGCLLSDINDKSLCKVQCEKNHQFYVKYSREITKVWCKACKQDEVLQAKKANQEAQKEAFIKLQKQQESLFNESKSQIESTSTPSPINSDSLELLQICQMSQQMMTKYFEQNPSSQISKEEMYNLYKILITPEDLLERCMKMALSQSQSTLISYYRSVSLFIHPDKNKHHLATETFQKFQNAYTSVKIQ